MEIARVILMHEPPSIDANEITDKGYINQRAVLQRRAELVERLYAEPVHGDVIVIRKRLTNNDRSGGGNHQSQNDPELRVAGGPRARRGARANEAGAHRRDE